MDVDADNESGAGGMAGVTQRWGRANYGLDNMVL